MPAKPSADVRSKLERDLTDSNLQKLPRTRLRHAVARDRLTGERSAGVAGRQSRKQCGWINAQLPVAVGMSQYA